MTMHFNPRKTRGIVAVRADGSDPAAIVAQIETGFKKHRDGINSRLDTVEASIADLAGRSAAVEMGGIVSHADTRAMEAVSAVLREARSAGGPVDVTAQLASAVSASGMSVGSDPDGGYTSLPTVDNRIREVERDQGAMRSLATVQPISGDSFQFLLNTSEAEAGWVGETATRDETDAPNLRAINIPVHEIYAMPKATQKLLDDSAISIGDWLVDQVGRTFGETENAAFLTGNGILKPKGLLTYTTAATADASRAWGSFEHINTGASGDFDTAPAGANKLLDTVYSLKVGYRRNASWLMSSTTAALVMKLKDAEGRFIFVQSMREGEPSMLLGRPVQIDEGMPAPAANSLSIAFGDFARAYTIVDRVGIRVLVDPFTGKPHVKFYCTKRVGGSAVDFNAMKFVRFGS